MEPLISVIVPVYNVEKYLEQCVESIRNQSYANLEIILVDDGSPDNCPAMCDRFAEIDERIRVIHKENGGLSDARNAGTGQAAGQYIVFVDSDDWIHQDMISILYQTLVESGADISTCEYQKVKVKERDIGKVEWEVYESLKIIKKWMYQKIKTSAWAILLPVRIAKKVLFPKGRLYEDNFTVYKYFWECQKVAYIPTRLYYYRVNPAGIMHNKFSLRAFDEIDAVNTMVEFSKENEENLLMASMSRKFSAYAQVLRWMPQEIFDKTLLKAQDDLWAFLLEYRIKMFQDKNARVKNRVAALCTFGGRKFFCKIFREREPIIRWRKVYR